MKRFIAMAWALLLAVSLAGCMPPEGAVSGFSQQSRPQANEDLSAAQEFFSPAVEALSAAAPDEQTALEQVAAAVQYWKEGMRLVYRGAETLSSGSYAKVTLETVEGRQLADFYAADNGFVYTKNETGALACVQLPPLADALLERYEQAFMVKTWLSIGWSKVDMQDIYLDPDDGYEYYRVTDERFPNSETFFSYLHSLFTNRCIEEELLGADEANIRVEGGKLYAQTVSRGANLYFAFVTFEVKQATEEELVLTQTAYMYDDVQQAERFYTEQAEMRLAYADGVWLFDAFPMYL